MRKFSLIFVVCGLLLSGAGCSLLGGTSVQIKPITLNYWRVDGDATVLAEIIDAYRKIHPNVEIAVTSFPASDYEQKLVEALAEDRGPDLFSLPNVKLLEWQTRLLPLPKETAVPTRTVNQQKQVVTVNRKTTSLTIRQLLIDYVEAVGKDVILMAPPAKEGTAPEQKIYGLPLSLDTLALYYNKDLLKNAAIERPPTTWNEFANQAAALTLFDEDGNLKQSGGAIGTGTNVRHSFELLSAIMAQNGAVMADDGGDPTFHQMPEGREGKTPPGFEALIFYTGFATQGSRNYCWDAAFPDSLEAFVTGKTAFYFGLPGDAAAISARAPKLNVGIAKLPQIDTAKPYNVARYPVEVVSKKTKNPNEAWDFIQFAANPDRVTSYLLAAKRPTALRALIDQQVTNPDSGVFAEQVLTAESWYRGYDFDKAEQVFNEMIDGAFTADQRDYGNLLNEAASTISSTRYQR